MDRANKLTNGRNNAMISIIKKFSIFAVLALLAVGCTKTSPISVQTPDSIQYKEASTPQLPQQQVPDNAQVETLPLVNTSSWKLYRQPVMNFSVNLPPNWFPGLEGEQATVLVNHQVDTTLKSQFSLTFNDSVIEVMQVKNCVASKNYQPGELGPNFLIKTTCKGNFKILSGYGSQVVDAENMKSTLDAIVSTFTY
jgi:hypothetical protein